MMDEFSPEAEDVDCVIEVASTSGREKSNTINTHVSDELKRMVIEALENGSCNRKTAASVFNLSYTKVCLIYNRFLKTGIIERKKRDTEISKKVNKEIVEFLYDTLADNCAYTFKELRELVKDKYSIEVGITTIAKEIRAAFHYNLKRVEKVAPSSASSLRMKDRQKYCDFFMQLFKSKRILIYFDETEFQVTVRQFYKRPPPGHRKTAVSHVLKSKIKTIMASMTQGQLLHYKAFDGPSTRFQTLEYLNGLFDLLSQRQVNGAVLIMDKAMSENCEEISEITEAAGHELVYLPPCSAFFNPIEKMFSQWDALVRSKNPKNEMELEQFIDSSSGLISSWQCQNYWDHAMYNVRSCVNGKLICIS